MKQNNGGAARLAALRRRYSPAHNRPRAERCAHRRPAIRVRAAQDCSNTGRRAPIPAASGTVIVKVIRQSRRHGAGSKHHQIDQPRPRCGRAGNREELDLQAGHEQCKSRSTHSTISRCDSRAGAPANRKAPASGLDAYERMVTGSPPNYAGAKTGLAELPAVASGRCERADLSGGLADYYSRRRRGRRGRLRQGRRQVARAVQSRSLGSAYTRAAVKRIGSEAITTRASSSRRRRSTWTRRWHVQRAGVDAIRRGPIRRRQWSRSKRRARLGQSSNAAGGKRATVDVNLVKAYLKAGQPDQAKKVAAEVARLDPKNTGAQAAVAKYYNDQGTAQQKSGDLSAAAASFEQGPRRCPPRRHSCTPKPPSRTCNSSHADNAKAQADAEKSLADRPERRAGKLCRRASLWQTRARKPTPSST